VNQGMENKTMSTRTFGSYLDFESYNNN